MKKQLNLELLRIFAMFIIVLNHFAGYAVELVPNTFTDYPLWRVFLRAMNFGGKIGVNIFVLITGYFMIKSAFKLKKLISLWLQVFAFSVGIYLICVLCGLTTFSMKTMIASAIPVTANRYWFFSVYFVLYLLSPVLNKLIGALSDSGLFCVVLVGFVVFSVWPTLYVQDIFHSELLWFIYVYVVGGWLSRRSFSFKLKTGSYFILMVINILLIQISIVAIDYSKTLYTVFKDILYFRNMNIVTALSCSVLIFLFFNRLKIRNEGHAYKIILFLSTATFSVYLLHMHPDIYKWIWTDLFRCSEYLEKWYFPLLTLCWIMAVFIAGTLVDKIRLLMIDKPVMKLFDLLYKKIRLLSQLENIIRLDDRKVKKTEGENN